MTTFCVFLALIGVFAAAVAVPGPDVAQIGMDCGHPLALVAVGFVMSAGFALSVDDFSRLLARYGHFVDMGTGSIFIGLALWMLGKGAVNAASPRECAGPGSWSGSSLPQLLSLAIRENNEVSTHHRQRCFETTTQRAPGETRTHTGRVLNPLPLPILSLIHI